MATITVVAVLLLAAAWVLFAPTQDASSNRSIALLAPSFVCEASANPASPTNFLEEEAGISVYFKAPIPVDLNQVRDSFRTIEVETSDYIIGSVPIGNNPESEDVHVYVHRNGWMVAYYLNTAPVAKIIDWLKYHETSQSEFTTKLENALTLVAGEAGITYADGTYYDFRFPNANRMMLIGEWAETDPGAFDVYLPSTLTYYERSWSLATDRAAAMQIDGNYLADVNTVAWRFGSSSGIIPVGLILPDQYHNVELLDIYYGSIGYGGLALTYREQ